MSPEQLHALAIAAKGAGKVRKSLTEGKTTKVSFDVHVEGDLIVNHGATCTATKAYPVNDLLALVLSKFGPRKRKAIVDELIAEVAAMSKSKEAPVIDDKSIDQAARLITETATKGTASRSGAVTGNITATLI